MDLSTEYLLLVLFSRRCLDGAALASSVVFRVEERIGPRDVWMGFPSCKSMNSPSLDGTPVSATRLTNRVPGSPPASCRTSETRV